MVQDAFPELEPAPTECRPPRRILVIDDDHGQVDVLSYRLGQQGFHVRAAHTLADGRNILRHEAKPELVLLDLRLPDGDGLELCRELGDDPETCDVPIVVVSGMEKADVVRQVRAAGGQFYLRKPYDPNTLLVVVQHALSEI